MIVNFNLDCTAIHYLLKLRVGAWVINEAKKEILFATCIITGLGMRSYLVFSRGKPFTYATFVHWLNGGGCLSHSQKSVRRHKWAPQTLVQPLQYRIQETLKQFKYDECLWSGENIMIVQYVDDCEISTPTKEDINWFVQGLKDLDLKLLRKAHLKNF